MPIVPALGIAVALLTFLAILAAGYVVIRSSALKQSAAGWRDEAEAQKARADRIEAAYDELNQRVTALEADNARLKDLATGTTGIADLRELVTHQHAEIMAMILAKGLNQ